MPRKTQRWNAMLKSPLSRRAGTGCKENHGSGHESGEEIMERLDELKQKYQSALSVIQQKGVVLSHLHVQDDKLFLQGAAPSEDIKNAVWNAIKEADPAFGDLTCDLSVDTSLPQPAADAP